MLLFFLIFQIIFESLPISSSGHTLFLYGDVPMSISFAVHAIAALISVAYLWWYRREVAHWVENQSFQSLLFFGLALGAVVFGTGVLFCVRWYVQRQYALALPCSPDVSIMLGLFFTALLLASSRYAPVYRTAHRLWFDSIGLILAQGLALLVPGVSRMATVYVAARWLGWSGTAAWYWTVATGLPLFMGAGVLGVGMILYSGTFSLVWWQVVLFLLAIIGSFTIFFGVGLLARRNRLDYFAWYLVVAGLFFLVRLLFF